VPAIPAPVHPDDEVRQHFQRVVVPTTETWLAEVDGRTVGVLVLHGEEVDQLYVDPDRQRRGIGSQLLPDQPGGAKVLRAARVRGGCLDRQVGQ
jgi:GNAT superfamily N-acetyltransferase